VTRARFAGPFPVTRRRFLQALGAVSAFGAGACRGESVRLRGVPASRWMAPAEAALTRTAVVALPQEVRTTLNVDFADLRIGDDAVHLRAYNGAIVGPTLRARAGDRVIVDLINALPAESEPPPHPVNGPHGLNITNLHSHGLHVSPMGGDNVFLEIGAGTPDGTQMSLVYDIPADHPPGTFWYHPHKHGSVAVQVASGMAGALIVEGDVDQVPEIAAAREAIFVFQQIPYNDAGTVGWDEVKATFGRVTTINGQMKPQVTMQPGEVQRWRFIHAGIKEKLSISLDGHKLNAFAYDGITTGRLEPLDTLDLYPGYRADVLVKASATPGTYVLMDLRDPVGLIDAESGQELAEIVVAGASKPMDLPPESTLKPLAPYEDLRNATLYRNPIQITFNIAAGKYLICGKEFDPSSPPIEMKLGGVDELVLSTLNSVPKPRHHPFHIHVNAFQQIAVGGTALSTPVWRDTVVVEKDQPVTVRMRHRDFTGDSVIHCHILDHEDSGMMVKFRIVDGNPAQPAC